MFRIFIAALLMTTMAVTATASISFEKQEITIALATEPPNLNNLKSTDAESFFILGHVMEGLTRIGKRGKTAPGVAEKWEITKTGATFWLRKDAKWSDGKPVTAHDFEYAWKEVVDPKTASQYAFIMYPIKNAETINKGKMAKAKLGVKAVDNWTLKVEFEKPCGYFLGLTSFGTFLPLRKDYHEKSKEKYASEADRMLYNGPFKLTKWVHGASMRLEKNENYWNKKAIKLNAIDAPYITSDTTARFNLYKDNKIAMVPLDQETIKNALKEKYKLRKFSDGVLFYHEFNFRKGRVTRNKNLRKAIQAAFDPNELVDKVIALPGNLPGYSLFPVWLKGPKTTFRKDYPVKKAKVDVALAKQYYEKAKKELGLKKISLTLLAGDSPAASKQAEYFQNLMKKRLGLELKIDKQTFKQRLAKMTTGDFDIVAAGWGPDFDDPMTFADLFASWNENNRGRYSNPTYDKWIRVAQKSADMKTRMDAMAKVQDIVVEDVAILPSYERGIVYVQNKKLKGVVRNVIGADPSYVYARVAK